MAHPDFLEQNFLEVLDHSRTEHLACICIHQYPYRIQLQPVLLCCNNMLKTKIMTQYEVYMNLNIFSYNILAI